MTSFDGKSAGWSQQLSRNGECTSVESLSPEATTSSWLLLSCCVRPQWISDGIKQQYLLKKKKKKVKFYITLLWQWSSICAIHWLTGDSALCKLFHIAFTDIGTVHKQNTAAKQSINEHNKVM